MAGRTIRLNWEKWQEYCAEHGLDPHKTCEDSVGLGGGDSYEVVYVYDQNEQFLDEGPSPQEEGDK